MARQQIELFEATEDDVAAGARGRNVPIKLGQVGIRCRHCASVSPLSKKRAAVYFPTKLDRVYQTAVNMATLHLCHHCTHIPSTIRVELQRLKDQKSTSGGGKRYVAVEVRRHGVIETLEDGLRFSTTTTTTTGTTSNNGDSRDEEDSDSSGEEKIQKEEVDKATTNVETEGKEEGEEGTTAAPNDN